MRLGVLEKRHAKLIQAMTSELNVWVLKVRRTG